MTTPAGDSLEQPLPDHLKIVDSTASDRTSMSLSTNLVAAIVAKLGMWPARKEREMNEPGTSIQKWCQHHWDQVRTAIDQKGLGHLVLKGGARAAGQVVAELEQKNIDAAGFDPLLRAWSMINCRALENGLGLVGCPLCLVQKHHDECQQPSCHKPLPQEWIDGCTDSLREYAIELKLLV